MKSDRTVPRVELVIAAIRAKRSIGDSGLSTDFRCSLHEWPLSGTGPNFAKSPPFA